MQIASSNRAFSQRYGQQRAVSRVFAAGGFTLVELLVVIGIIALLISILMPSLGIARQAAQRVSCSAKLHSMMLAAHNHAMEHKGFYPLAGVLPGIQPPDLYDTYGVKYSYLSYNFYGETRMIAPITIALSSEMTYGAGILAKSNNAIGAAETDDAGFIKNFICPGQAGSVSELNQTYRILANSPVLPELYLGVDKQTGNGTYYTEALSYIFNEAVVGWGSTIDSPSGRLRGNTAQIHQPSLTMFAADGFGASISDGRTDLPFATGAPILTVYNALTSSGASVSPTMTLADAWKQSTQVKLAGDTVCFDRRRHRGKINIAFCDGHVDSRNITNSTGTDCPDLKTVYLLAP